MSTDDPRFITGIAPGRYLPGPDERLICTFEKCRTRNPKTSTRCLACGRALITPAMDDLKRRLQSGNPDVAAEAQAEVEEMRARVESSK